MPEDVGATIAAGAMGGGWPSGLGGLLNRGPNPVMQALSNLGVQLPAGVGGVTPKQLGETLRLAQQWKNYTKVDAAKVPPTWAEYMADPRNQLNIVMDQWESFNRVLRNRGEEEIPLFQFMQQAGIRRDIIEALASVYQGGVGGMAGQ